MKTRHLFVVAVGGISCLVATAIAMAGTDDRSQSVGLVREVRQATRDFRDVSAAVGNGYMSMGSCVSGPQEGAMGIHYPKGSLVGDGVLDAQQPEVLIYEQKNGRLRLVGVEFIVLADAWDKAHPAGEPPILMGQHFQFVGSPNRYRLPAFYELHVWAWRDNPSGMFVDWNPNVSCEEYTGEEGATHAGGHGVH